MHDMSSMNNNILTFLFPILKSFILFLVSLSWLGRLI